MKILIILGLLGAAIASSEWQWEARKEYVYDYSGKIITGIPELSNSHFSGLSINCTVHVFAFDNNRLQLSVRNPKYVRINEDLKSFDQEAASRNWRELRVPEPREAVSEELVKTLREPIAFTLVNGEVKSIHVPRDNPTWVINFKKSLALQLQTKVDITPREVHQNMIFEENSNNDESYWRVKEESLDGVCETTYLVRELPEYFRTENSDLFPYREACEGKKFFSLTKTRDVGNCEKTAQYSYYKPGHFTIETTGNNLNTWARSSSTRYLACGQRGEKLVIQSIVNDAELNQDLLGFKTEKVVTGTIQVWRLKEIKENSEEWMPNDMIQLNSMLYEYYPTHSHQGSMLGKKMSKNDRMELIKEGLVPERLSQDPKVFRKILPRNFISGLGQDQDISSEEIKKEVRRLTKEIVRELVKGEDIHEKQVPMKTLSIARGLSLLPSSEEIKSVFQELKGELGETEELLNTLKNIFNDCLLMSGTPQAVKVIKHLIDDGELTDAQIKNIYMWMSQYIVTPTEEVLEHLYDISSSHKIRKSKLFSSAILGFSTLLQKACLEPYRRNSYPEAVFGEMCKPDSKIVVKKWIPYLFEQLKSHETSQERKNEIIVSLGVLAHPSTITKLVPYAEGSVHHANTKLNRYLAIVTLSIVGKGRPAVVLPILTSIMTNPAEISELRIVSLNGIMTMDPAIAVLHKIAALTWTDDDQELLKSIYTSFASLDRLYKVNGEAAGNLAKKASLVYPLVKKIPGVYASTGTAFEGDWLSKLGIGYDSFSNWDSSSFYSELYYVMETMRFSPVSLGFRLKGLNNLRGVENEVLSQTNEIHKQWKKVIEELNLKTHDKDGPMDGAFWLRLLESSPIFYNFDKSSAKEIREMIKDFMRDPLRVAGKVCGDYPINIQRALDMAPNEFLIPSDMGFPIIMEVRLPTVVSIKGSINVDCIALAPSVNVDLRTSYSSQYIGWVGTINPFSDEYVLTGIDQSSVANIPMVASLKMDVMTKQMSLFWKPVSSDVIRPHYLGHFHVRPFTVVSKVLDLTPVTLNQNIKYISSVEEIKKSEQTFGETFGIGFKTVIHTESKYNDFRSALDTLKLYNYNVLNVMRFSRTVPALSESGNPSVRRHEFCLIYEPDQSSTREIKFDLRVVPTLQEETMMYQESLREMNGNDERELLKVQSEVRQEREFAVDFSATLIGSRAKTWAYHLTAGTKEANRQDRGVSFNKYQWHAEVLYKSDPLKKVWVEGEIEIPLLPYNKDVNQLDEVKLTAKNTISFGEKPRAESSIKLEVQAKISNKQKEYSQQSEEARKCQKMREQNVEAAERSYECKIAQIQAQSLDKVDFEIEYQNVAENVRQIESRLIESLKRVLWPFLKRIDQDERRNVSENKVLGEIRFDQHTPSFDMELKRQEEIISFKQIRVPYPLNKVLPLKAVRYNDALTTRALMGDSAAPVCKVDHLELITYFNKTLPFRIDYCFHLLSGDCSDARRFGILIRNMKPGNRREMRVFLGDLMIVLSPARRERGGNSVHFKQISVYFEEVEASIPYGKWMPIDYKGQTFGNIFKSEENIIEVKAPQYNTHFIFDGFNLTMFGEPSIKKDLCGLCGTFEDSNNLQLTGPGQCVYSKPELQVESYKVKNSLLCQDTETENRWMEREQQKEKRQCVKYQETPTKLKKSLKEQSGRCTVQRHAVLRRQGQVCFSKKQVLQCSTICSPVDGKTTTKSVSFACIPTSKLADDLIKKANSGKPLPEVRSLRTDFEAEVEQPKKCSSF